MNNLPVAGDILPARQAIDMIPQVDLGPPIEVPPIPSDSPPEGIPDRHEQLFHHNEIQRLKKKHNAILLAHKYQVKEIQEEADFVGDSLDLAKKGKASRANVLVEASVIFMNQILAINKRPDQIVLAPDLGALCSLAAHADPNKIRAWKREHSDGVVVSYVNTYLEVKAESDYCCASANAAKVIKHVIEHHPGQPTLFLPDVYLGYYAAKLLQEMNQSIDNLWLMMGACHVHDSIRPSHILNLKRQYPDAAVVIHPECGCTSACMRQVSDGSVPAEMMQFRSTQGMADFIRTTPQKQIIMATEVGNIYPMQKAAPHKIIIPANPEAVCAYMKQNTLRKVYESLRDMKHEITVDPELAERARIPIDRMLAIV